MSGSSVTLAAHKKVHFLHEYREINVTGENVPVAFRTPIPFAGSAGLEASLGVALAKTFAPLSAAQFGIEIAAFAIEHDHTEDVTYLTADLRATGVGAGDVSLVGVTVFGVVAG